MRCCTRRSRTPGGALLWLLAAFVALTALATEVSLYNAQLIANEDGYTLSADANINFNTRLEEAVNKGVVLYFTADFELTRPRWYWLDETVVRRSRTLQLSSHALMTRQYRLSTGALYQNYTTLDEALRAISRLRNWQVIEKGEVKPGQMYVAALRLQLDLSQMPKTFQVGALANKDWVLTSDWQRWSFTPAEGGAGGNGDGK
jgi:hypothetical protein